MNNARSNYKNYSKKIDQYAQKIKFEENSPILDFYCNDLNYKIYLTQGISSFKESSNYLRNINGKLNNLKILDTNINLFKHYQNNPDQINKNVEILLEKVRGKYKILAINIVTVNFDDPEMTTMISIVDGEECKGIREIIFSKEITHVDVKSKRLNEKEKVIYYVFAKEFTE